MTTRVSKISAKKELGVAKLFDVSKSSKTLENNGFAKSHDTLPNCST